jgi:hypothetical protein
MISEFQKRTESWSGAAASATEACSAAADFLLLATSDTLAVGSARVEHHQ